MTRGNVCVVDDCSRVLTGRGEGLGMCGTHYQRLRKHGDVNYVAPGRNVCVIEDCGSYVTGHGWCSKHYTRWRRYGSPTFRLPGEVVAGKKICRVCSVDKPVEDYTRINDQCRPCQAASRRAYRKANPDYWRQPYDPAKHPAKTAAWRKANPDKVRAATAVRRARRRAAFVAYVSPAAIFERDGWVCGICSDPIDPELAYPHLMSASLDHVIPLAKGGTHEPANTQASHLLCNIRKGAAHAEAVI